MAAAILYMVCGVVVCVFGLLMALQSSIDGIIVTLIGVAIMATANTAIDTEKIIGLLETKKQ